MILVLPDPVISTASLREEKPRCSWIVSDQRLLGSWPVVSALVGWGGAATMTSRLAPVLPSTIVTVTLPGDFAEAGGGRVAVAAD